MFSFRVEKDGYNYTVAICSDTSKLYQNVSVTKSKYKGETIFLGRRNESHLVGEGNKKLYYFLLLNIFLPND